MNYLKLLEQSYEYSYKNIYENIGSEKNKYVFLADQIFEFTTYDDSLSEFLCKKALEVCIAITDKKTFKYIEENNDNYIWFITMCNMDFFNKKIDWGASIRGCWWKICLDETYIIDSCGIYNENGVQIIEPLVFNKNQWIEFIYAMKKFVESK